ncbi:MAG: GNAT family N-acetyltransferase [Gammaproteobacteria bacterium]|nr:GNAT family N-acetyltransferase [Gammaproteobacteria bacterium]
MEPVTIYYLEMRDPGHLEPSPPAPGTPTVAECLVKQHRLNRFLYRWVGEQWQWTDKLGWSDDAWQTYVYAPNLKTYIAYEHGAIVGYYELQRQKRPDGFDVEIIYFGLTESFIGHGYGGWLLTSAVQHAWAWDATRVWVHTCSLDHPAALANYQARGFRLYRVAQPTAD